MSQTIALKMVQASLATAMSYLSVVWGIMSGYLVFSEVKQFSWIAGTHNKHLATAA
jgi:drug/metabolite transporter (DMT)-like permease